MIPALTRKEGIDWPLILGTLTALVLLVLASVPELRDRALMALRPPDRHVLSKANADLSGHGDQVTLVKVKTNESLSVEVYFHSGESSRHKEMKRIVLPYQRDGYFNFRNNATNLALADLNNDGILEIMAPAFDENLMPRLFVYRFDLDSREFYPAGPGDLPL